MGNALSANQKLSGSLLDIKTRSEIFEATFSLHFVSSGSETALCVPECHEPLAFEASIQAPFSHKLPQAQA